MDNLRKLRYKEKIELVRERIKQFDIKPQNKMEKWGLFYAIQTAIESVFDLIAMLVKDMGIVVKDDEDNVERIMNEKTLDDELGKQLKDAKGMRNIIVHQYNGINEGIIFNSLPKLKHLIEHWINIIEGSIDEFE
jgi:uncharacterized protein YutE (UPF0331/DUF86 family)